MGNTPYSGPERRLHARHAVQLTFWLLTNHGTSLLARSESVSAGGAFLRVQGEQPEDLPAVGAKVRFKVTSDSGVVPEEASRAEVVRRTSDGIAIRFLDG